MTHSTGHSPHSPRQQINFRITQLIKIQYYPILEPLENSGIELQCTVHTVKGTQTSVWQAAGADAPWAAWLEHIPIQQSLRPLAYKLCRQASFERKENRAVTDNFLTYFHHFRIFTVFGRCMHILQYCSAMKVLSKKLNPTKFKECNSFVAYTYCTKWKEYRCNI